MAQQEHERIIHPIPALYDNNSEILILGSFPSVKTREQAFFYGNPQNRFWDILATIWQEELSENIEDRREFLLRNKIALWDVIYACDIIGSADSTIKNVEATDLRPIIETSGLTKIFCNGATSFNLYKKYHEKVLGIQARKLPSSSPANARYRLDDLVNEWKTAIFPDR